MYTDYTTEPPQTEVAANEPRKYCSDPNCERSGQMLPLSEFHTKKGGKYGVASQCKQCKNKYTAQWLRTDKGRESHRRGNRRYNTSTQGRTTKEERRKRYTSTTNGKNHMRESTRRHREKYPNQWQAHTAINRAVTAGRMPKVETLICAHCGVNAQEYHHHLGYEKEHWLDAIPLCTKCHKSVHKDNQ